MKFSACQSQVYQRDQECSTRCLLACQLTDSIPEVRCNDLCDQHCMLNTAPMTAAYLKCQLTCTHLNFSSVTCQEVCPPQYLQVYNDDDTSTVKAATDYNGHNDHKDKKEPVFDVGCMGYGTEICYRNCRLRKKEKKNAIRRCQCLCCKCLFT